MAGILVTLLGALDQGARLYAEGKLEDRVEQRLRGASNVEASISSFPFLGRLLVAGSVPEVGVVAERTAVGDLVAASVAVRLRGVQLSRDALYAGNARVEDIDSGEATIDLDIAALGRVLRVPLSISDAGVTVTIAGRALRAAPVVEGGDLVLRAAGVSPLRVPLARHALASCDAAGVRIAGGRVRLSCTVDDVPPALRR